MKWRSISTKELAGSTLKSLLRRLAVNYQMSYCLWKELSVPEPQLQEETSFKNLKDIHRLLSDGVEISDSTDSKENNDSNAYKPDWHKKIKEIEQLAQTFANFRQKYDISPDNCIFKAPNGKMVQEDLRHSIEFFFLFVCSSSMSKFVLNAF